jgi:hypothetical protein
VTELERGGTPVLGETVAAADSEHLGEKVLSQRITTHSVKARGTHASSLPRSEKRANFRLTLADALAFWR